MVNELGITRDDIETWTKEAVTQVAEKKLGQMDINGMTLNAIRSREFNIRAEVIKQVASEIAVRMKLVERGD